MEFYTSFAQISQRDGLHVSIKTPIFSQFQIPSITTSNMLRLYECRDIAAESRDDDQPVARDSGEATSGNLIAEGAIDIPRDELLNNSIADAQSKVDDAKATQRNVKCELIRARIKLGQLKRKHRREEDKRFLNLHDILFNQIPGYRNTIPPISEATLETDDQVGPYELIKCIGEGGFAKVYLCKDERSSSTHAIKCYDKSKIGSLAELANLGREIQVMSSQVHSNVVNCVDVIHAEKNIYLIMDLSCCDLMDYQRKWGDQMTDSDYSKIVRGIVQGLECLHYVGIAHLDLKPENILISRDCRPSELTSDDVKICDFGLCAISDAPMEDIEVHGYAGTPGFISPELMLGYSGVEGRQSDIFSLGVLLLELIEGAPARWFQLCTVELNEDYGLENLTQELKDELATIHDREYDFESGNDLIRRLLVWDPESRYTALQALMHPWVLGE